MTRRRRFLLPVLLTALLTALLPMAAARAQAPSVAPPAEPSDGRQAAFEQVERARLFLVEPSFFVETIEVLGLERAQPEVVIAESLLAPGQEVDERQLRDAMLRIRRLPFLLDASFALRKGSERGRYRLEITVVETLRFFFGEDLGFTRFSNSVAFDTLLAESSTFSSSSVAGVRFFPGRTTMLYVAAGHEGVQGGVTRYNLFNRRVVASAAFQSQSCCPVQTWSLGLDPTFSSYQNETDARQMTLSLGLPLRGNHSLRLQIMRSESDDGERRSLLGIDESRVGMRYRDLVHQRIELAWTYNTTDDPVLPTRGLAFTVTLDAQEAGASMELPTFSGFLPNAPILLDPPELAAGLPRFESRQTRISAALTQHWPIGGRQVVSASARVGAGQAEIEGLPVLAAVPGGTRLSVIDEADLDLLEGYFTLRYSVALWGATLTRERGDFRGELGVDFGYDRASPTLDLPDNPLYRKAVLASLVFRNRWGVFRATFQIADYGRGF